MWFKKKLISIIYLSTISMKGVYQIVNCVFVGMDEIL